MMTFLLESGKGINGVFFYHYLIHFFADGLSPTFLYPSFNQKNTKPKFHPISNPAPSEIGIFGL